jgi:hypothetical protein
VYYIVIVIKLHDESPDLLACPLELHVANLHIIPQFMHGLCVGCREETALGLQ